MPRRITSSPSPPAWKRTRSPRSCWRSRMTASVCHGVAVRRRRAATARRAGRDTVPGRRHPVDLPSRTVGCRGEPRRPTPRPVRSTRRRGRTTDVPPRTPCRSCGKFAHSPGRSGPSWSGAGAPRGGSRSCSVPSCRRSCWPRVNRPPCRRSPPGRAGPVPGILAAAQHAARTETSLALIEDRIAKDVRQLDARRHRLLRRSAALADQQGERTVREAASSARQALDASARRARRGLVRSAARADAADAPAPTRSGPGRRPRRRRLSEEAMSARGPPPGGGPRVPGAVPNGPSRNGRVKT